MRRLAASWLGVCLLLAGLTLGLGFFLSIDSLAYLYFARHDLPVVFLGWIILALAPSVAFGRPARTLLWIRSSPRAAVICLGVMVGVIAYLGAHLVFESHALSGDEQMAAFDAAIFGRGRLSAEVAPEWRPYVPALQPIFRLEAPGNAWWTSTYLPVNAMARAAFARLGDGALAGPFWAGLSVLLVWAVARRLRPDRPEVAVAAAVLLATSSQLLVAAMTPYAMSAHLALNLLWLWLLLRGGAAGHGAAMVVALAATGLHQLIFHPLFAAPFVLKLWLERRFAPAAAHTLAYLAIGLFWTSYGRLLPTAPADDARTLEGVLTLASELLTGFGEADPAHSTANLLRFVVWLNPLTIPLLLSAPRGPHFDRNGLALWAGLIGTAAAMIVILPYQGHGWGYRYLHGLLGNACLLAAGGWVALADRLDATDRRRAWTAFGVVACASVFVLLPLRAWQAHRYVQPYAAASRAIAASRADIVLVDTAGLRFGVDLVRNHPFLHNRPKVMHLPSLDDAQLRGLCRRGALTVFDVDAGRRLGVPTQPIEGGPTGLRRLAALGCAAEPFHAGGAPVR